jgi:steroid delta-isomerase-like uncharacterized protein
MNSIDLARAYIAGWSAHETDRINSLFAEDGTYSDPIVPNGIRGAALAGYVNGLIAAFPDLDFDIVRLYEAGADTVVVEWLMKGTNRGSFMGLPPTGRAIALPGVDVIETGGDRIKSVRGYFNSATMMAQIDVQVIVRPKTVGPVSFGSSTYTHVGSKAKPGVIGVTQIQLASPDQNDALTGYTRAILQEISQLPGYIGTATSLTWDGHGVTLTAWEDMGSAKAAVQSPAHLAAMKAVFEPGGIGVSVWTSFWTDGQLNTRWQRCGTCGGMAVVNSQLQCKCGAAVPESPWF